MIIMDKHDVSWEPMEVDISANSAKSMEISYNEVDEENIDFTKVNDKIDILSRAPLLSSSSFLGHNISCQLLKPEVRRGKSHVHAQIRKQKIDEIRWAVMIIFTFLLSTITFYASKLECNEKLDTGLLRKSLERKLFGQGDAIDAIIETLDSKISSRVLFFFGGTGVGKTYTASILLENIHNFSNIYHYTMPSFTNKFSTEFLFGLTICKTSLIIVDDLKSDDLHNIMDPIKSVIEKSESLKKNITIILIYSCDKKTDSFINKCDKSFEIRLQNAFNDVKGLKRFINFKQLTDAHLLKCIGNELEYANVQNLNLAEIKKHFNVSNDGCKGVHKKIRMLST